MTSGCDNPALERAAEDYTRATLKARGIRRRYTGDDYIVHCEEVVAIVKTVPHDSLMVAGAWLHDIVEECFKGLRVDGIGEIHRRFGAAVGELVDEVTDISTAQDGPRSMRKKLERDHMAKGSSRAQTIRVADMLSNIPGIMTYDAKFARVYVPEKAQMLATLDRADPDLVRRATTLIQESLATLKLPPPAPSMT